MHLRVLELACNNIKTVTLKLVLRLMVSIGVRLDGIFPGLRQEALQAWGSD